MTTNSSFAAPALILAGGLVLLTLSGCVTSGSGYSSRHSARVSGHATLIIEDDYEYYPHHEIYYSRRRNEYVYRENNTWVRRPELRGLTLSVLTAGPMVRMDFRDSPEHHHDRVVQRYPRNWAQSGSNQSEQQNRRADRKAEEQQDRREARDERKAEVQQEKREAHDDRKDRKEERKDRKEERKNDRDDDKNDRDDDKKDRKDDDRRRN